MTKIQRRKENKSLSSNKKKRSSKSSSNSSKAMCFMLVVITILLVIFSICTPILLMFIIEDNTSEVDIQTSLRSKFQKSHEVGNMFKSIFLRKKSSGSQEAGAEVAAIAAPLGTSTKVASAEEEEGEFDIHAFKLYYPGVNSTANAKRGHINCDVDVDFLAYWNDPQSTQDQNFISPFGHTSTERKYITFEPDKGGWNNIRMSMENMFVIAAATGRTLVLPPDKPLYLLKSDKNRKSRGFADFYNLENSNLLKQVQVMSMEEFIKIEGSDHGRLPVPLAQRKNVTKASKECVNIQKSDVFCDYVFNHLTEVGGNLELNVSKCFIFDLDVYHGKSITSDHQVLVDNFCSEREVVFFKPEHEENILWHFQTFKNQYRLLIHFYNLILFTDPKLDHYFKRFIRDFLRYRDEIFCAAGKVIKAMPNYDHTEKHKELTIAASSAIDKKKPGFSTAHVRRGDFQYKKTRLTSEDWYETTKHVWLPNEPLYIATDERDKSFFRVVASHHATYFLDDFWKVADLDNVDPNYLGMIDTIVASQGREFVGTYFSTFSGFINRMRGYKGISMMSSWYVPQERMESVHTWGIKSLGNVYAKESPEGWVRIDDHIFPDRSDF